MTARAIGDIAARLTAWRDPSRIPDPVLRSSYDVDDKRAQVFKPVGDGSSGQGWAHIGAVLETFDAIYEEQGKKTGRNPFRLQPGDRFILKALGRFIDFATGALFPELKTIAEAANASKQGVVNALKRLSKVGLIDWVRRSVKTEGEEGPKRKQTSNAYYFNFRHRLDRKARQTFLMALARRIGKIGGAARARLQAEKAQPKQCDPATEALFSRIEANHFSKPSPSQTSSHYPRVEI